MKKNPLNQISAKKQKLIDAKNVSEFSVGESVIVPQKLVYMHFKGKNITAKIIKVNRLTLIIEHDEYRNPSKHTIKKTDVVGRDLRKIGANPISERFNSVRPVAFSLDSIISSLDLMNDRREEPIKMNGIKVKELNWNPYVYDNDGKKRQYQRDFCWSIKDYQLLIESIYNKIDCGKLLIRLRGWVDLERMAKNGETQLAFKDIVDGKQRMRGIQRFLNNEFPDLHGNYYNDLSAYSQRELTNHQLFSYAEMPENTSDEEVIYQFLKMNFTGVPQSQEHLDFVKEISKKM